MFRAILRQMPKYPEVLDEVFYALSSSTRRQVVERLGRGPAAVTDLARNHEMALPSFMQHLRVLEKSGLVKSIKSGRTRVYTLQPLVLSDAESWISRHKALWECRLDSLDAFLISEEEKNK